MRGIGMPLHTTWGSVREGCNHAHRSIKAAKKCILADDRGCHWQGGHSDRFVWVIRDANQATDYHTNRGPGQILPISFHTPDLGR